MKNFIKIFSVVLLASGFVACEDLNDIVDPDMNATIDKTELKINESMTIRFTGDYDQMVVWTGDEEHDYDHRFDPKYDEDGRPINYNAGIVVSKDIFTYSYRQPGVYTVYCIATNSNENAQTILHRMQTFTVTVTDPYNHLTTVSAFRSPYYEFLAQEFPETGEWFLAMPRKFRYNGKDVAINLKSHNLNIVAESDAAEVLVNGTAYSSTAKYNLTEPVSVVVTSGSGDVREYSIITMFAPEITAFSINGVKGTVTRSDYDYLDFTIEVDLPDDTDLTALVPTFTLSDPAKEKATINGVEQVSGTTAVDFSQPVEYVMTSVCDANSGMIATSRATVVIK